MDCQTGALTILQSTRDDTYQLLFRHNLCDVCGICEKILSGELPKAGTDA